MTVFILSAFGAALLMIGVAVFFVTAGKKKEFIKLDVMHRPKRYIALPKATKQSNQNGQGPAKEEKGLDDPDRSVQRKGPEVVFTAQDVNNQVKKEFSIGRCDIKKTKSKQKQIRQKRKIWSQMCNLVNNSTGPLVRLH